MSAVLDPNSGRDVLVTGGQGAYQLNQFEPIEIGLTPQSIAAAVAETDIDLQINIPFYQKSLSLLFSTTNSLDYIEVFILKPDKSGPAKKIGSTFYIMAQTATIDFATIRDSIPKAVYPSLYWLRIAFQNKSGIAYTFTPSWSVWIPTSLG